MINPRNSFAFALFLLFSQSLLAQGAVWARGVPIIDLSNTAGIFNTGRDVDTDAAGNVYMAGEFYATVQFGSEQVTSDGFLDFTTNDGFIAKYDADGNFLELFHFAGEQIGLISELEVSPQGEMYFAGTFLDAFTISGTTFDPSPDEHFIGQLDVSGNVEWIRAIPNATALYNLVLAGDELYLGGTFAGAMTLDAQTINSSDGDYFLVQLSRVDGTADWAAAFGTQFLNAALGVAVDAAGNVYCAGNSPGGSDIGPFTLGGTDYEIRPFLVKFNAGSDFVWMQSGMAAASGSLSPQALAVHPTSGELYMVGSFNAETYTLGELSFSQSPYTGSHMFVAKYDGAGEVQWVRTSKQDANASAIRADEVHLTDNGDLFVLGQFQNGTNGYIPTSNGPDLNLSAPLGNANNFILRYTPEGEYVWGKVIWADNDGIATFGMHPVASNQVAITGRFFESAEFGNLSLPAVYPGTLSKENIFLAVIDGDIMVSASEASAPAIDWTVSPNPANEYLQIQWPKNENVIELRLLDMQGSIIGRSQSGNGKMQFNIRSLSPGYYLVQLITDNHSYSKRILKN